MTRGIVCTIVSAVLFGVVPTLTRVILDAGANVQTVMFARAACAIAASLVCARAMRVPLAPSSASLRPFVIAGALSAITAILLCQSYVYIPVGLATTLHYTYPMITSAICALMYDERGGISLAAALVCCTTGVALSAGASVSGAPLGVAIALASGITFGACLAYTDHSALRGEHILRIVLWSNIMLAAGSAAWAAVTDGLVLDLPLQILGMLATTSSISGFIAMSLLYLGVKLTGSTTASILSTFEPLTSTAISMAVYDEPLTPQKAAGTALVVASVIIITMSKNKIKHQQKGRSL